MASIEYKVKKIISEQLGYYAYYITNEKSLVEDLMADELDIIHLIMALEDYFDIEIDDTYFSSLNTVGDVLNYISGGLPEKNEHEKLIEFLKNHLNIRVDFNKSYSYWDSDEIEVQLLIDDEVISHSSVSIQK